MKANSEVKQALASSGPAKRQVPNIECNASNDINEARYTSETWGWTEYEVWHQHASALRASIRLMIFKLAAMSGWSDDDDDAVDFGSGSRSLSITSRHHNAQLGVLLMRFMCRL